MRVLQVITEKDGVVTHRVYVDGYVLYDVTQPEQGFFGWKNGTFDVIGLSNKAIELARKVNEARDKGEQVVIDTIINYNGEINVGTGSSAAFAEDEVDSLADYWGLDVDELIDNFLVLGYIMDWYTPAESYVAPATIEGVAQEVNSIEPEYNGIPAHPSAAETYPLHVDESKPIDVPLTPEPAYTPSYQAEESRAHESAHTYDTGSSHSYDSGSSHDSGSSYDSGGSSDCGGGGCGD